MLRMKIKENKKKKWGNVKIMEVWKTWTNNIQKVGNSMGPILMKMLDGNYLRSKLKKKILRPKVKFENLWTKI